MGYVLRKYGQNRARRMMDINEEADHEEDRASI